MSPFHVVSPSPWPILGSFGALGVVVGLLGWFQGYGVLCLVWGLLSVVSVMVFWWRDVCRESLGGHHTWVVQMGLRFSVALFIVSEVFFFLAFFWAYFHSSLSVGSEMGLVWPPRGVIPLDPYGVPLLNTLILLSSACGVTMAHSAMFVCSRPKAVFGMGYGVVFGFWFLWLQAKEYQEASFTIADSVYGSCFFVATGFHGLHVFIGSVFLLVMSVRLVLFHFSSGHHLGLEASIWYWHFVDVVWLFLYVAIY